MIDSIKDLIEFSRSVGQSWTRFWFNMSDPRLACKLRIAVGLVTLLWFYSISSDLETWFGPRGMAPDANVQTIIEAQPGVVDGNQFRWSFFRLTSNSTTIWILHLVAFSASCTLLLGLATPLSAAICALSLVSYTHRAPMLFGKGENVLIFSLIYLGITACGRHYSLDSHFRKLLRRGTTSNETSLFRTNVGIRLLQVHLAMVYLFSAMSKFAGDVWWQGDAIWWLAIQPESSLADLTGLAQNPLLMNFWTHAIVLVELAMGVLVWIRPLRIILVGLSTIVWISLVPLTGEVAYCLLMMILNFSFFDRMVSSGEYKTHEPIEVDTLLESSKPRTSDDVPRTAGFSTDA